MKLIMQKLVGAQARTKKPKISSVQACNKLYTSLACHAEGISMPYPIC